MNEMTQVLGTVAMEPKGEWSSETYYEKLNTVLYNDSTYMAKEGVVGEIPSTSSKWQLIGGGVTKEYVADQTIDNLDSTSTTKPLSAKQGNNLNKAKVEVFDTVALMKTANLKEGMVVQTLGYYAVNDGGHSEYIIVNDDTLVDDGGSIHVLSNGLRAKLIDRDTLSPEIFGAYGDNTHDDSVSLLNCFNYAKENELPIKLTKQYYINSEITLDGELKRIDFIQDSGFLKIDGEITIKNITYADIKLNLQNGGSGDIDTYGVIFQKLSQCKLNLQANSVNKTAFFMNSEKEPTNIEIKFCNVTLRGKDNLRTLLHGSSNSSLGDGFGNYIDIVDGTFTYPIKFINCRDVNILHYENFIDDTTFTKNSLEFINAGIRASLLCLGGKCKNLLYMEDSGLNTDYLMLINEDRAESSEQSKVTGVYIKGNSMLTANFITNSRCLYTVDAHEMVNQSLLEIGYTSIYQNATPLGRGTLAPTLGGDKLLLSYNHQLRADTVTVTSPNFDLSHIRVDKMQNYVHINGYIQISADVAYNTTIIDLGTNNKASYTSIGYIRQSTDKIYIGQVTDNTSILKNMAPISVADGTVLYIDMLYRTRQV